MNTQTNAPSDRRRAILGIGVLSLAMFAGSAGLASAASVAPSTFDDNQDCEDLGFDSGFKIDGPNADADDTYGPAGFKVIVDFEGNDGNQPTSFDFEVDNGSESVFGVIVKAGSGGFLYGYAGGTDADTDLTAPDGKGISHVEFCYNATEEDPTPTPTVEPTPTPTVEPTPTPIDNPTPTPAASVGGETGTPSITLPPTDTIAGTTAPSSNGLMAILAVLAGVLASAFVLTPSRKRG